MKMAFLPALITSLLNCKIYMAPNSYSLDVFVKQVSKNKYFLVQKLGSTFMLTINQDRIILLPNAIHHKAIQILLTLQIASQENPLISSQAGKKNKLLVVLRRYYTLKTFLKLFLYNTGPQLEGRPGRPWPTLSLSPTVLWPTLNFRTADPT